MRADAEARIAAANLALDEMSRQPKTPASAARWDSVIGDLQAAQAEIQELDNMARGE